MTRERAKELLPVIQAFADGKEIQFRMGNGDYPWVDVRYSERLFWERDDCEYRIKPTPREWWFLEYSNGTRSEPIANREYAECRAGITAARGTKIIHVKEVE